MCKFITLLVIISNNQFHIYGNRTITDSLLQEYLIDFQDSSDSVIAQRVINLYLKYGFPFVQVKIHHKKNLKEIIINEGPIVKFSGIIVKPQKYKNLVSILPQIKGKTFSPELINRIKSRIRSIDYVEIKGIKFIGKQGKIFLSIYLKENYPPNSINSAITVTSKGFSGFLNLGLRHLYGRPFIIYIRYNFIRETRKLDIGVMFPYLLRSPFGVYGSYVNEIEDSINYLSVGGGIIYNTGRLKISNGIEKNILNRSEETTLGNFLLKYTGDRVRASFWLKYSKKDYRNLFKIGIKLSKFHARFAQFGVSSSLELLRPDLRNRLDFLRGYEYGTIDMRNGWTIGIDVYPLRWAFLFVDYGKIQNREFKSAGIGVISNKGMIIYGIHPGIPWYDGILTISLKISL